MVQKNNSRKGATLAEMIVVLAVVVIISTMVVSFAMMVSQRTAISSARLNTMNDVYLIESIAEGWIVRMDKLGGTISTDADGLSATVTASGATHTYTLIFDESKGQLQGTLPNGEILTCRTKQAQAVAFRVMKRDGSSEALYFCTVTAQIPRFGNADPAEQEQIFCINPHEGETVGGGA